MSATPQISSDEAQTKVCAAVRQRLEEVMGAEKGAAVDRFMERFATNFRERVEVFSARAAPTEEVEETMEEEEDSDDEYDNLKIEYECTQVATCRRRSKAHRLARLHGKTTRVRLDAVKKAPVELSPAEHLSFPANTTLPAAGPPRPPLAAVSGAAEELKAEVERRAHLAEASRVLVANRSHPAYAALW